MNWLLSAEVQRESARVAANSGLEQADWGQLWLRSHSEPVCPLSANTELLAESRERPQWSGRSLLIAYDWPARFGYHRGDLEWPRREPDLAATA